MYAIRWPSSKAVILAMTQGYHDRPTQLLPKEDIVKKSSIDGNKYTKDYESNDAALGYF